MFSRVLDLLIDPRFITISPNLSPCLAQEQIAIDLFRISDLRVRPFFRMFFSQTREKSHQLFSVFRNLHKAIP